jgi:hypothetical protein
MESSLEVEGCSSDLQWGVVLWRVPITEHGPLEHCGSSV